MEWYEENDPPATSGDYLVWADYIGRSLIAEYQVKSRAWYCGEGMQQERINIDKWAHVPEPPQD